MDELDLLAVLDLAPMLVFDKLLVVHVRVFYSFLDGGHLELLSYDLRGIHVLLPLVLVFLAPSLLSRLLFAAVLLHGIVRELRDNLEDHVPEVENVADVHGSTLLHSNDWAVETHGAEVAID
jgi:hypothetical protein